MKVIILAFILIGIAALFMDLLGTSMIAFVLVPIVYWFDRQTNNQKNED